jgi:hypothetical protein
MQLKIQRLPKRNARKIMWSHIQEHDDTPMAQDRRHMALCCRCNVVPMATVDLEPSTQVTSAAPTKPSA